MADRRRFSQGQQPGEPKALMGPPETPSRVMEASPNLFPTLQFSPDLFSAQSYGPSTAPIYPQQRLFWDPSLSGLDNDSVMQQYQDPFALGQDHLSTSFASTSTVVPSFNVTQHMTPDQTYELPMVSRSMNSPYVDSTSFPAPFTTSPRKAPPREENPSLFLSSPARRFGTSDQPAMRYTRPQVRERPAYHHQLEESRRELDLKRNRKIDPKHPSVTRSVMEALRRPVSPIKDNRPSLKRSLTHSGVSGRQQHLRRQSHVSFADSGSVSSITSNHSGRPGRASPLQFAGDSTNRPFSSGRGTAAKRTSLSLSIDENGVAKTVVTKLSKEDEMDIDQDDLISETSSIDQSDFQILRSQNNSFVVSDDEGSEHSAQHALSRSLSHSRINTRSTANSRLNHLGSNRKSFNTTGTQSRVKRVTLDPMLEHQSMITNHLTTGDAQHALRSIIQDRSRSTSTQGDSITNDNSMQFHSSPPMQQNQFGAFNTSPTTITDPDLATPSTDRESVISNTSTRCVCSSSTPESPSLMIQW